MFLSVALQYTALVLREEETPRCRNKLLLACDGVPVVLWTTVAQVSLWRRDFARVGYLRQQERGVRDATAGHSHAAH